MKRQKADFDRLIAELEADARDVRGLIIENSRAMARIGQGAVDSLDWAALGYTIHNLYGVIENYCLRIAKFFENWLSQDACHKELLRRMMRALVNARRSPGIWSRLALEIPGVAMTGWKRMDTIKVKKLLLGMFI